MTITIGWWLLPLLVTVASFAWAIPMRKHERPTGGMFDGLGYVLGAIRTLVALVVSLAAWLFWSLIP